ncbi:MAG TPA: hypothetical protein VK010_05165 [Flavobacteriaceae bacterium]|nr:hypothetical protein [Flavobacteriaceae bacterium]
MKAFGHIRDFPKNLKVLTGTFLVVLSVGFFTGIRFVDETSGKTPHGIQENYLGNEDDLEAEVMKFKKPEKGMLNIIHSHILSMSLIFFVLGFLVYLTKIAPFFKKFLMMEPLLSVLFTFGGIWFLWKGILWMSYVVMLSGMLMTLSYTISVLVVIIELFKKPTPA